MESIYNDKWVKGVGHNCAAIAREHFLKRFGQTATEEQTLECQRASEPIIVAAALKLKDELEQKLWNDFTKEEVLAYKKILETVTNETGPSGESTTVFNRVIWGDFIGQLDSVFEAVIY